MSQTRLLGAFAILLALGGCHGAEAPLELRPHSKTAASRFEEASPAPLPVASSATPAAELPPPKTPAPSFADLVAALSEPDAPFFSDNYVSNEMSYLDVAETLERLAPKGGAYVGVGPEQSFSYIALTKPKVAYIVDIRRQNMLLHLLYKAIFDASTSRSQFLCLLTGRPYEASSAPSADASIDAVLAHAERLPPSDAELTSVHTRLLESIEVTYGVHLDAGDKVALEKAHRAFFKGGLDLRFELKKANGRSYPTLRQLLAAKDPRGKELGFLASEESFRFVQKLEHDDLVIPVVGDVAGDRALPGIASDIAKRGLTLSAFYISNVEQYLFEPGIWSKWTRNVAALPKGDQSLFIRAYLDQGRRHPKQRPGERTATVLQRVTEFEAHNEKRRYDSFWAVATDASL